MNKLINLPDDYNYDPNDFNFIERNFSVEKLVGLISNNKLILGENKWDIRMSTIFIESILVRIPTIPLYLENTGNYYKVLDGNGRLFSLKLLLVNQYNFGEFDYLTELNNLKFYQLSRKYQRRILETDLTIHIIELGTPQFIVHNIRKRLGKIT
ncbi:MAG: hypothetical protein O4861_06340 [Trichodesmium sp. St16_bin4-tuft]|nr:hypothetical protein [Trichodesmium sp. St5_bin8]MDE5097972.1 hypothetical protein [Trichodesmium sp. St16_bin4-tuft]MDE5102127.1 hypothetical protein [Trichodesmium sp. St19_bin2]